MSKSNKKPKDLIGAKIINFIENGRQEITTKEELDEYPIGSLISYTNKNNQFESAGFLTKITDEYFIYINPDFSQKYRVRFNKIIKMWVADPYKVINDLVSIVKTNQTKKTNFPVIIDGIVIFYAKSNFDIKRFRSTDRYQQILKWYKYFIDPNFDPNVISMNKKQLTKILKKYNIPDKQLNNILKHLSFFKENIQANTVTQFGDSLDLAEVGVELIFDDIKYDLSFSWEGHGGAKCWFCEDSECEVFESDDKFLNILIDAICEFLNKNYQ